MVITSLILIFIVIIISGFFSASETAITAASKARFHQKAKSGDLKAQLIKKLQGEVGLVISAYLICNTFLNAFTATMIDNLFSEIMGVQSVLSSLISSFISGGILVLYAEVSPKILAVQAPETFLMRCARPLYMVFRTLRPLTRFINFISRISLRIFGVKTNPDVTSHTSIEELRGAIDMHQGPGEDVIEERAMLKSILDLGSVQVVDIMIHRKNVTTLDLSEGAEKIMAQVLQSPYTRFPIWKDETDNIVGILHAKDLFRAAKGHEGPLSTLNILTCVQRPWFVPESTDLLDQLKAFRKRREHFAIVVDEYGSLMGIVTLEDILEEIVGDISDEHDVAVKGVRSQGDGSYIIDGNVTIRDLNRQLEWDLPDNEASTLAGLLIFELRLIPRAGQTFMIRGFRFDVIRRQRNQLTLIRVTPPKELEEN
jgi:Mg2+/Co2+ transporter CorB